MGSRLERGREVAVSKKRKDSDVTSPSAQSDPDAKADLVPSPGPSQGQIPAGGGGKLLAGYLAHEFLTRGTLLGRLWDPAAAAAARPPVGKEGHRPPPVEDRPQKREERERTTPSPETMEGSQAAATEAYAEVAYVLKGDGAGIPGVVNPTQLVRWLQM